MVTKVTMDASVPHAWLSCQHSRYILLRHDPLVQYSASSVLVIALVAAFKRSNGALSTPTSARVISCFATPSGPQRAPFRDAARAQRRPAAPQRGGGKHGAGSRAPGGTGALCANEWRSVSNVQSTLEYSKYKQRQRRERYAVTKTITFT